jgi:hypothetical protein
LYNGGTSQQTAATHQDTQNILEGMGCLIFIGIPSYPLVQFPFLWMVIFRKVLRWDQKNEWSKHYYKRLFPDVILTCVCLFPLSHFFLFQQFFSCAEVIIVPNGESLPVTAAPVSTSDPVATDAPIPPLTAAPIPVPTFPITSNRDDTPTGPINPACGPCAIGSVGPCQNADGACFAYRDEVNQLCWPGSFDCNKVPVTDAPTKLPTGRPSARIEHTFDFR